MSQENVEIVRGVYSLFGDPGAFRGGEQDDVFLDYFAPDYELIPPPIYPDAASSYRGLEGTHEWQRLMDQVWVDWRLQAERFFDAGDQVAVSRTHIRDRQAEWGARRDFGGARLHVAGWARHAARGVSRSP